MREWVVHTNKKQAFIVVKSLVSTIDYIKTQNSLNYCNIVAFAKAYHKKIFLPKPLTVAGFARNSEKI